MNNIKFLLGQRIKELRKSRNLTQEQFAEMIDIDQRNLSSIECGINFPTKHFIKIAEALEIEISDLFKFNHLSLTEDDMRTQSKTIIDTLNPHDLTIIYRLLKSIVL